MRQTRDVVIVVLLFVDLGLVVAAVRAWRRQRGPAAAWLAVTFVLLGAVVLTGTLLPVHSDHPFVEAARKAVLAGLLLFPYALYRFTREFDGPRARTDRAAAALTLAVVLATALVPDLPERGAARPGWWAPYAAALLIQWTALALAVAMRLWQAGRHQATVARRRMRLMAMGAVVLDVAMLLAVTADAEAYSVRRLAAQLAAVIGVCLLYVGFVPPVFLRVLWRQPEVQGLRNIEFALMATTTAGDVADTLLPHVTGLFGGRGAALVDGDGQVVGAHGLTVDEAAQLLDATGDPDVLVADLSSGRVVVKASTYTPFFGREELSLLHGLALLGDLALTRAGLFEEERRSREAAERANAELETFVYTVSHDLKSPLVSVRGFVELLTNELGERVEGNVSLFLKRIDAGATYMDALVRDLLELSRIGRVATEPGRVDLAAVVHEVGAELGPTFPEARLHIEGDLPMLHVNPLRARQLVTNLVGNAFAHAGRPDVTVTVGAVRLETGDVRLVFADDGKGIPADQRARVFGVFERLEARDSTGTGIGLAVCRKIVDQCGGTIEVAPSARGARFEVVIPAHCLADDGGVTDGAAARTSRSLTVAATR